MFRKIFPCFYKKPKAPIDKQPIERVPAYEKYILKDDHDIIWLDEIESRYIDLAKFKQNIVFAKTYQGDRLILKNTSNKKIVFADCTINSTHREDAIAIDGDINNTTFIGDNWKMDGALTFWKKVTNVNIYNLISDGAHTGIRATADLSHSFIHIENCKISNTLHEGIYVGPSKKTNNSLSHVSYVNNVIEHTGWCGLQLGNCIVGNIYNNVIKNAGRLTYNNPDEPDSRPIPFQGYGITINPGSIVYEYDNQIIDCRKPYRHLDSRVFGHSRTIDD